MGWGPVPIERWAARLLGAVDLAMAVLFGGITALIARAAFSWPGEGHVAVSAACGLCSTVLLGVTATTSIWGRYNRPVTTVLVWSAAALMVAGVVTLTVATALRGADGLIYGVLSLVFATGAFGSARRARSSFPVPGLPPPVPRPVGPPPPLPLA